MFIAKSGGPISSGRAHSTTAPAHKVKPSAPNSVILGTGVEPEQVSCCLFWLLFNMSEYLDVLCCFKYWENVLIMLPRRLNILH